MGEKIKHIHWVRVIGSRNALSERDEKRRDECTANIQLRIMRNLVNQVNSMDAMPLDVVLKSIDCLPSDWRELVETLNVE